MLFSNISIIDENFEVKNNMYVGISGEFIDYVGNTKPAKDYGEVYDGNGALLMPGFYNTHAHSPMSLMRGYGENLVLQDWLDTRILPFEDELDSNAVYWGTTLCVADCLRYGIVSSSDMYFFVNDIAKAAIDGGVKANIARSLVCFDDTPFLDMASTKELISAYKEFHNTYDGRIKIDASLHAEYTSTEALVKNLTEWTAVNNTIMQVHISETQHEYEGCKKRHGGLNPVQYLNSCGLFDVPTIAAHCVWLDEEDYDILHEKNVTVSTCPCSNLKLASGIANTAKMLEKGIKLSIGTDSVASNNSLNFIEEMKVAAMVSKVRANDPTVMSPKDVVYAATRAGALAQGREDCGLLKKGYRADLIVVDADSLSMHPSHNILNNLVYSANGTDVVLTMVDGKVLYNHGEYATIDVEKTIFELEKATGKILAKVGN